jgi:hypothetical protein
VQNIKTANGNSICEAMLTAHLRESKRNHELELDADSDKENMPSPPSKSLPESQSEAPQCLSAKRRREEGFDKLVNMFKVSMEEQHKYHMLHKASNDAMIDQYQKANEEACLGRKEVKAMRQELRLTRESHECTSNTLIDILKQGLLN